jgi:hypothetical protein
MAQALFFLIPLAFAVAMGLWLRHARQREGHRWITHWLATLAPLGLLAGLHSIGLINNAVAQILMGPTVLGVAAFAGGALYLAGPTLLTFVGSSLFAPSLTTQMKRANAGGGLRKNTHDDSDDDYAYHSGSQSSIYPSKHDHLYAEYDYYYDEDEK